jgi:hypothetical protein
MQRTMPAATASALRAGAALAILALTGAAPPLAAQALPETVLEQPRVRIGVTDGDSAYLLFGAQQALRTADGHIVVINFGTQQIREYDAAGRHVRTLGRRGDGPGEFRMLQQIGLLERDSIAAYDIGTGRITVFGRDGRVARANTVQPFGNTVLPRAAGFTRQGGLLVHTDFDRVFRSGESRDSVHFAVTNPLGVPVDTIGSYAAAEMFTITSPEFGFRRPVIFGRDVHASARGERLVIGASDAFRFDVFFAGGRTRRSYEHSQPARQVSRQDVARANRDWLDTQPERVRERVASRMGEFPHRETYPAFAGLLAAADGSIWVQEYPAPGSAARRWTVFGADGRPRRTVRATMPITIVDAGADYVLAWTRDGLGVERILLFDLPPER